jgi:hypothetical protein
VRTITKVVKRGGEVAPVREDRREPALIRPEVRVPVTRTPVPPAGPGEVKEMTLADLAKLVDQRKRGVREVVLDDPTDEDDLDESAPIVLSRGSQSSLAARMLRGR